MAVSMIDPLTALGAFGPAASGSSVSADARKKTKNGRRKKRGKRRKACRDDCATQVGSCEALFASTCQLSPEVCAARVACCRSLEDCDFTEFHACLVEVTPDVPEVADITTAN